jgi:hypothetical protein
MRSCSGSKTRHNTLAEIKALKDRVEAENIYLRERSTAQLGKLLDSRPPRFNQLLKELAQVSPHDRRRFTSTN